MSAKDKIEEPIVEDIEEVKIESAVKQRFLDYAMSVITSRALPDIRDGLKPVHRRILYAMHQEGLHFNKKYRKSAATVGTVLGNFHPHGDSAVYDALARMTQDWSLRYPLIDGQGNFGSYLPDPPASMRYTEARMDKKAYFLLKDIHKNAVDFRPNYDNTKEEPVVIPSILPNLLLNGTTGIAVGMATNMAPHNIKEVGSAIKALLENEEMPPEELFKHIPGPDFPLGAKIQGRKGRMDYITTGRGKILMRSHYEIEDAARGKKQVVMTDIPFQTSVGPLIQQVVDLVKDESITELADIRDESSKEGIRVVFVLKKDEDPEFFLKKIWKYTGFQSTFGVNNTVLVNGRPQVVNMKTLLVHHIHHRIDVIRRITKYDLDAAEARKHIVDGLITALNHIDEVIQIIKDSSNAKDAQDKLGDKYSLSEAQTKAILDMRLQKLSGLERTALEDEHKTLIETIKDLKDILESDSRVKDIIREETDEYLKNFGDDRRTVLEDEEGIITHEDFIPESTNLYSLSKEGYIKRLPFDAVRAQRRGGKGLKGANLKEEDYVISITHGSSHDWLCMFTNKGRLYWKKGYDLPESTRTSRGKHINQFLTLQEDEKVKYILTMSDFEDANAAFCFVTKHGVIKRSPLSNFKNVRSNGLNAINLDEGDEVIRVLAVQDDDQMLLAANNGLAVRFPVNQVRPMGRGARGVTAMKLIEGQHVVNAVNVSSDDELFILTKNGQAKRTLVEEYRVTSRGTKGVKNIALKEDDEVIYTDTIQDEDTILITADSGLIMRMPATDFRTMRRGAMGVRAMKLKKDDYLILAQKLTPEADDEE